MSGKLAALHSVRAIDRIRYVREEIAADRKKHLDVSIEHRVQTLNGVIPRLPGWFKVELFPEGIQKRLRRTLPHSHCAVTLDIRVSTPLRCCVTPVHHAHMVFFESAYISAATRS